MILTVEGRRDVLGADDEDIAEAVASLGSADGPTYVVLQTSDGSYMQAAGSGGRFVVEARDVFGEGFQHWRAFRPESSDDTPAVVKFLRRCPHGKHPPRGCPVNVRAAEVVDLTTVSVALQEFSQAGTRVTRLGWRDVSAQFLPDPGDGECRVREIRPRAPDGRS